MEVVHEFRPVDREFFDDRLKASHGFSGSGVWRFKELVDPDIEEAHIVTRPEGNTNLYARSIIEDYVGLKGLKLKHEGENPTGSFKDRGMTVGISEARRLGARAVSCASTGNTSASLAAYAAQAGVKCVVFIPEGEISYGKLAQALSYGAEVLQIRGNFDDAMRMVQEASEGLGLYLLNSVNPWRVEGQKTIIFELIQQLGWEPPDWVVVPAGNLGNTSAFGKALVEMESVGLIDKVPRIASVQAEGANPFYRLWSEGGSMLRPLKPETVASAIKIGNPVSWRKALKAIHETRGVVECVSDQEIMDAKAVVDRSGVGCEPASAASVAGARKLVKGGVIGEDDEVVCVLTGHLLKDPDASINYHKREIRWIEPGFANPPKTIEGISDIKEACARGDECHPSRWYLTEW